MTISDVPLLDRARSGRAEAPRPSEPWVVLSEPGNPAPRPVPGRPRVLVQLLATTLLVMVGVAAVGALAARGLAESEAVAGVKRRADLLADAVVQPVLSEGLLRGDPDARRAVDRVVGPMRANGVVRVKLWTADGRVVYSDEPRLVGRRIPLGEDESEAFGRSTVRAEVTDLSRPENRYERGRGKLLEAYRRVEAGPSRTPLLFETYWRYDDVRSRAGQVWRGFGGLMVSSLLLLTVLQAPLLWRLLRRIRQGQEQREDLLRRAVDASQDERRRIAGTLHDGVVQELAASSFALAGSVERAAREGSPELARQLSETAATVRGSIGGLRSLLVDIYPPSLASAGLVVTLVDAAGPLRARDVDVELDLPPATRPHPLTPERDRLVYRIVHECLANVGKHAAATRVLVRLRASEGGVVLDVADNGIGFDAAAVLAAPAPGHLGLRVLADLARDHGAGLAVSSAPGRGTWWRLQMRP